ncbi:unnamed protein product [Peniophora sp. CBMAI 1063]|nr:unnamed protein product [Peniophora sp. CBMAI 1063]
MASSSAVPIAGLKHDILLELFALIAATDVPHALPWVDPGPLRYHLGWVRLTHVCRLWRVILVDEMPQLWADAVCRIPPAHDIMLTRARDRPLTLNLNISLGQNLNLPSGHIHHERLYNFALANIGQAEAFHALHATPDRDWVPVLDGKHLPSLKYLELIQRQPRRGDRRIPVLRSLDAPNLLWANLEDISLTFTSTTLRHLCIFGHQMFCNPEWSILDVLGRLPLLEWLSLDQQPHERADYSQYQGPPISLEHLKLRRLYGNANSDLVTFSKHLPITPRVQAQLRQLYHAHIVIDGERWEEDFIAAFGPSLNEPSLDGLLVCDEGDKIFVSTFPACEKPELAPRGCKRHFGLDVLYEAEPFPLRIGLAVLEHVDSSRVKQLAFEFKVDDEHMDMTVEALRMFTSVTDFAASTRDVLLLLSFQKDGSMLFPNLESLHAVMEAPIDTGLLHVWWDRLVRAITDRSAADIPIRCLRLADDWRSVEWSEELATIDAMGIASVTKLLGFEVVDDRSTYTEPYRDHS